MIGKQFKHYNGIIYTVICLTNEHADPENSEKYPVTVVYMGTNGKVWSRLLSTWTASFKEVDYDTN